jgi:DNA-directed RNA polymerase specialized sigma24 family protein
MRNDLGALVERARNGDRESLAQVVEQIQGPIYNLALRMLWHPEDARDATQGILIRVITHLGSSAVRVAFRHGSTESRRTT